MDETPTIGLHTRGPQTWFGAPGEYVWDFDDNMRKVDAEIAAIEQALTALGGAVGGTISLDSGTF